MSTINFLPWRQQRQQRRNDYVIAILFITLAMTIIGFTVIFITINHRYQYMIEQKSILDKNYQKNMLLQQKYKTILQQKRRLISDVIAKRNQQKTQQKLLNLLTILKNNTLLSIKKLDYDKHALILKAIIPDGITMTSVGKLLVQAHDIASMTVINLASHNNTNIATMQLVLNDK